MERAKMFFSILVIAILLSTNIFTADKSSTAWISTSTLSSVVKLGVVMDEYYVEGLPEGYEYKELNGKPYFGTGKLLRQESEFVHVGSGVLVTETGLIVSNAHVTMAYDKLIVQDVFADNQQLHGPSGRPVSVVVKERYRDYMFVGVAEKSAIERGDDRQKLKYAAKVLCEDSDYDEKEHDRAVLQITNEVVFDSNGIPCFGKKISGQKFSYAKLANPFKYDYLEKDVRAVGFPGVGDPNRAAVTLGTRIGYLNEEQSVILHTSFISGGNSGGALFYNNSLVGINTWDNLKDASRPVAMAQPISYWNKIFSGMKWIFPDVKLPEYSDDWLKADPSLDTYDKNMATVYFSVMQAQNTKRPVNKGYLLAVKKDLAVNDLLEYIEYRDLFRDLNRLVRLAWIKSDGDIMDEYKDISQENISLFRTLTDIKELRPYLKKEIQSYFDLWISDDFVFSVADVLQLGKVFIDVPRNNEVKILYSPAGKDDDLVELGELSTSCSAEQGPYYIYLEN